MKIRQYFVKVIAQLIIYLRSTLLSTILLMLKRNPLYVCFVDFKKAFDKVSHALFWQKLVNYSIDGKFINIIKSMYSKVKS